MLVGDLALHPGANQGVKGERREEGGVLVVDFCRSRFLSFSLFATSQPTRNVHSLSDFQCTTRRERELRCGFRTRKKGNRVRKRQERTRTEPEGNETVRVGGKKGVDELKKRRKTRKGKRGERERLQRPLPPFLLPLLLDDGGGDAASAAALAAADADTYRPSSSSHPPLALLAASP